MIIHILTLNNSDTIQKTFDSISGLGCQVLVGDLGSTDDTIQICENNGAKVLRFANRCRRDGRKSLCSVSKGLVFYIEPWEILIEGHKTIQSVKGECYVSILKDQMLFKEVRLYSPTAKISNPIFEFVDSPTQENSNVILYCLGQPNTDYTIQELEKWKLQEPLAKSPYYYHACLLLAGGEPEKFMKMAEQYLFLDKTNSMSATMMRYYYAYAQTMYRKEIRPALQNINLCLCAKPLMAEFWCLLGDIYYHKLHKFMDAKEFYENAKILGSQRLKSDLWPMDISKYNQYPTKMINSCEEIYKEKGLYLKID